MLSGYCSHSVLIDSDNPRDLCTPRWMPTPGGKPVMGIDNDGCSAPVIGDKPEKWLNFRVACDSHDYGYGLIRMGSLPAGRRLAVDAVMHTIVVERICSAQSTKPYKKFGDPEDEDEMVVMSKRDICKTWAGRFKFAVNNFGWTHV
ncbi:hypothetical protein ACIBG7_05160 [Nonomuraea sp. NPDC050328]|uniref:hypothetical protein n=1 Tax=Nonomuraea sp. NPDC050328 TaxID=3364361 RepID=UPI0037B1B414